MGVSLSTLIFSYIASADEEMAERIAEYYREVEKKITELRKDVDVASVVRKADNIKIPDEIEADPEFNEALKRAVYKIKTGQTSITTVLEWLTPTFENIAIKHGYVPESRAKLKMYLVSRLKSELNDRGVNKQ